MGKRQLENDTNNFLRNIYIRSMFVFVVTVHFQSHFLANLGMHERHGSFGVMGLLSTSAEWMIDAILEYLITVLEPWRHINGKGGPQDQTGGTTL